MWGDFEEYARVFNADPPAPFAIEADVVWVQVVKALKEGEPIRDYNWWEGIPDGAIA